MAKFDKIDWGIIKCLHRDARMSSAQIAREIGGSARTIQYRLQRLIDLSVLQPVAILNPAAFGYTLVVDIYCELEVGYQEQAIQVILEMPNVNYVAYSTGDQDISLHAIFRDSEEMHTFITQKLHPIPGMRHTRTVLLPRVLKDTHQWFPSEEILNDLSE